MQKEEQYRPIPATFATVDADYRNPLPYPVTVETPPQKWAYGGLSSVLDLGIRTSGKSVFVRIEATVQRGPVGIGLLATDDIGRFVATEQFLAASDLVQEAVFLVPAGEPCRICVRTGDTNSTGVARIEGVHLGGDPRLLMEHLVNSFPHWYYTVDFGGGFIRRATVPDEPGWTRANAVGRAIFRYLITRHIGPIEGTRVLDVACSAGPYSFFFAGMGASVHGFDHDQRAIEQARVVAEYTAQGLRGSVEFSFSDLESFSAPAPFDIVFCSGLFYHLGSPLTGAKKLHQLSSRWLILQSCVSGRGDVVFELSDPARWPFCAGWEFCLVPTAAMVQEVFERVGFRIRAAHRLSEFVVEPGTESASLQAEAARGETIERLGDPIYLVLEKA